MTFTPLALVPGTSALLYAGLIALARRRPLPSARGRAFSLFLVFMAANALASLTWRLVGESSSSEYLLRALELPLTAAAAPLLVFLAELYPTRWTRRAWGIGVATVAITGLTTLSGAMNRVTVDRPPSPEPWHVAFFALGSATVYASFIAAFGYLLYAYHGHRDPFERNRIKYVGASTVIIFAGMMTNLVPPLRVLPLDQAANAVAASLLAFVMLRYRLLDVDVVLRRGLVRLVIAVPTSFGYVGALMLFVSQFGLELTSAPGAAVALAIGFVVAFMAGYIRMGAEAMVDRLFVGKHMDRQAALAELTRRSGSLRGVDELAHDITAYSQPALDASFVALLLRDEAHGAFRLASLSGPFPRIQPEWTISDDNPLVRAISSFEVPVTPFAFAALAEASGVEPHQLAEFGPYRECIAVPVLAQSQPIALLFVGPKVYAGAFTLADLEFLTLVAGQAALSIQNARLFEQVRDAAQTDFITGLPNHRQLQDELERAIEAAGGGGEAFSVAMVDIDNFKLLNDVHGHQVGDEALRSIADVMRASIRPEDIVGRYGGDEFLFILPHVSRAEGTEIMTQVARQVRRVSLFASDGEQAAERLPARISWGLSTYPEDGVTRRALISAADSRLMQRKFEGRRAATVHTDRPTTGRLLESDPEKLRIARALIDLIDAKDPYTAEHSQQIAAFALLVADELGLPDQDRYALWLGSLLHDVGKVGTPAEVLRKPGRLTPEEWDQMRKHPALGERIVRGLLDSEAVSEIVGCHHERFDGSGYPRGLAGTDIPRMARIVAVADAFSAMVHDRPYRKGLSWAEAMVELQRNAGTQFDPEMVEVFLRAVGQSERRTAA